MSPILGIWASAQQPALNATSFESIATATVGSGGSSTITFSSIPSTYTHLQLRILARDNRASFSANNSLMQFNSDTGSNYAYHLLYGDGSSAAASAGTSDTFNVAAYASSASASANIFGAAVVDILDYKNTNKYKTTRTLTGLDLNGSGNIRFWSGLWMSTNAITSISIYPSSSGSFQQYSSFALYGIKGA